MDCVFVKKFLWFMLDLSIYIPLKKKFDFVIKSPPASHFIREAAKLKSGSKEPGRVVAGSITMKQAEKIAQEKMKDLNAHDLEEATKIICGSARSMGIEVKKWEIDLETLKNRSSTIKWRSNMTNEEREQYDKKIYANLTEKQLEDKRERQKNYYNKFK